MSLAALIRGRRDARSGDVATATPATVATDGGDGVGSVASVATVAVAKPAEPTPDPEAEARRQRVLAMLAERPDIRYAFLTDTEADPEAVILELAIRGAMSDGSTVTFELHVPREKYDPFLLLDLIARHGGVVH